MENLVKRVQFCKHFQFNKPCYIEEEFHDIQRLDIIILFQIAWSNSTAFSAIGSTGRRNETFGGSISDSGGSAWTGNDCEQRSRKENSATARRGKTVHNPFAKS